MGSLCLGQACVGVCISILQSLPPLSEALDSRCGCTCQCSLLLKVTVLPPLEVLLACRHMTGLVMCWPYVYGASAVFTGMLLRTTSHPTCLTERVQDAAFCDHGCAVDTAPAAKQPYSGRGSKGRLTQTSPHSGRALGIVVLKGRPRTAHAGMFL